MQSATKKRWALESKVILATAILSLLIFLAPPWKTTRAGNTYPDGIHFIDSPPVISPNPYHYSEIDYRRLKLHFFMLYSLSVMSLLIIRQNKKTPSSDPDNEKFSFY